MLLRLENEFLCRHLETFHDLCSRQHSAETGAGKQALSPEESVKLEEYIAFFCKLEDLRKQGAVNLETLDRMFGFRFFAAMHNRSVHRIINQDEKFLGPLQGLYSEWKSFRESKKRVIPTTEIPDWIDMR